MIELHLKRKYLKDTYTIGKLSILTNGSSEYLCDTLEDKVRDLKKERKIKGKTAIPAGRYKITLILSPKFKRLVPLLHNVPKFTAIEIHPGNSDKDTEGCILPGQNKIIGQLINSTICFNRLMQILLASGQKEWYITIE